VKLAIADVQKRWDVAAEVQEGVQLDGRLGRAKRGPRKHRQAQVDGAGIERVDPQVWLADVLDRIAGIPQSQLHGLLPWQWKCVAPVRAQAAA
jgi:hypothetical protein